MPQTAGAVELDDQPGPADGAAPVDVAGGDQPAVGELGDEAGDRGLVQAGLLRDPGPRARTRVAQQAEHQSEVAAPDGGLVGGRVSARRRSVEGRGAVGHARLRRPRMIRRSRQQITAATPVWSRSPRANSRGRSRKVRRMTRPADRWPPVTLVAGVDTSTQACKVVVRDADTGELVRGGPRAAPRRHRGAPRRLGGALRPPPRRRPAVWTTWPRWPSGGQQHGMVCLDEDGEVVRDALLWNDVRSAGAARRPDPRTGRRGRGGRPAGVGGRGRASSRSRRSPRPSCAGWPTPNPRNADRTAAVCLPHDWLTWRLSGRPRPGRRWSPTAATPAAPPTGRPAPASTAPTCSSGRCAAAAGRAAGRRPGRGRSARSRGGRASSGPGPATTRPPRSGWPPARATSSSRSARPACVSAVTPTAVADVTGTVAGFADATGNHLPLVATLNAARVLDAAARLLGVDHATPLRARAVGAPGADGLVLVPYLEGERTPNLPARHRRGARAHAADRHPGAPRAGGRRGAAVRAGRRHRGGGGAGRAVERVLLVGGAARSPAVGSWRRASSGVRCSCRRPASTSPTARRRQAAWVLSGGGRAAGLGAPGLETFEAAPPRGARALRRGARPHRRPVEEAQRRNRLPGHPGRCRTVAGTDAGNRSSTPGSSRTAWPRGREHRTVARIARGHRGPTGPGVGES